MPLQSMSECHLAPQRPDLKDHRSVRPSSSRQRRRRRGEADTLTSSLARETSPSVAARTRKLIAAIDGEIGTVEAELQTLGDDADVRAEVEQTIAQVEVFLRDPVAMWEAGDVDTKIAVFRAIFPDDLLVSGREAQTTTISPIFGLIPAHQALGRGATPAWHARQGSNLRPPA